MRGVDGGDVIVVGFSGCTLFGLRDTGRHVVGTFNMLPRLAYPNFEWNVFFSATILYRVRLKM